MTPNRPSTTQRKAARRTSSTTLASLLAAALATVALPALAQYKVVGPDGKITYTDRAPSSSDGRSSPLSGRSGAAPTVSEAPLPAELRQSVSRYPVTLYTATGACEICTSARELLRTRGIPYAEKQVLSAEDGAALQRLSGGQDVPTLTIGTQTLRGLSPDVWTSYLDAAGYPKESRLPTTYQYPAPTSITTRASTSTTAPAAAPAARAAEPAAPPPSPEANPTGIKF